jgi:hypothetical protein
MTDARCICESTDRESLRRAVIALALATAFWVLADESKAQSSDATQAVQPPQYALGDTWRYKNYQPDTGDVNRTWRETVTSVSADGAVIQRVDHITGKLAEEAPTRSTIAVGSGPLKFPFYKGKQWSDPLLDGDREVGRATYLVEGAEDISTPAGKFSTVRIASDFVRNGQSFRQKIWYAPAARTWVRTEYYRDGKRGPTQRTELIGFSLHEAALGPR